MKTKILQFLFCILLNTIFVLAISAQDLNTCAYVDSFPRKEPLPDNIRERMITLCIEENKKEFNELIERTEELAKLGKEIEESFIENQTLSVDDKKKLEQADELVKKIRKELRADKDDDDDKDKPSSMSEAIQALQKNTTALLDEIKKTTRHSISAAAIQSSNTVLKIVKFLRFGK